jgi:hypothetical protein
MDEDFAVSRPLVRPGLPHIRFLYVRSRFCSTLLSDVASRRRPCASLALHLHQVVRGTCTPKLSNMLGTQLNRCAVVDQAESQSLPTAELPPDGPLREVPAQWQFASTDQALEDRVLYQIPLPTPGAESVDVLSRESAGMSHTEPVQRRSHGLP